MLVPLSAYIMKEAHRPGSRALPIFAILKMDMEFTHHTIPPTLVLIVLMAECSVLQGLAYTRSGNEMFVLGMKAVLASDFVDSLPGLLVSYVECLPTQRMVPEACRSRRT